MKMSDENVLISSVLQIPAEYPPCDFTFLFPSSATHELGSHKDVLSSKCEFFRAMFSSGMADAHVVRLPIDEFSPVIMSHFLHYLYHNTLHESFCGEHFMGLFNAGTFFECPDLCCLLLDSVKDICTLCVAVESLSLWPKEIFPSHFLSFVAQNLGALTPKELTGLSKGALQALVSVACHGKCQAISIFRLLETWACANSLQTLPLSLIELVPFERMWAAEFEKHVEPSPFVPKEVLPSLKSKVILARNWSLLSGVPTLTFNYSFEFCCDIAVAPLPTSSSFMVYVTDSSTDTVHMFDGSTGQPMSGPSESSFGPSNEPGDGPGQFNGPTGIAVSRSSGGGSCLVESDAPDVFVSDFENHRVQVFSAMGVHKRSFGSEGTDPGQLMHPDGLSIDLVKHEVHVCDTENNRISVFAESDGRHLFSYGSEGFHPGHLYRPTGVAVDGERGLVAVVDIYTTRVSVFKTSGEFVRCLGHGEKDSSDPKGQFSKAYYKCIAVDLQSSHIIVSDSHTKRVQVMTWEGEWVGGFGPGLPVRGPELKAVRGVAVGPQGQLFVCCEDSDDTWKVMCF